MIFDENVFGVVILHIPVHPDKAAAPDGDPAQAEEKPAERRVEVGKVNGEDVIDIGANRLECLGGLEPGGAPCEAFQQGECEAARDEEGGLEKLSHCANDEGEWKCDDPDGKKERPLRRGIFPGNVEVLLFQMGVGWKLPEKKGHNAGESLAASWNVNVFQIAFQAPPMAGGGPGEAMSMVFTVSGFSC